MTAELRVPLPRGDLQLVPPDPLGDPADLAVAGEEAAAEREAAQGAVEVGEGLLGDGGHGVAVEGEEGELVEAAEAVGREDAEEVEAEVKDLETKEDICL